MDNENNNNNNNNENKTVVNVTHDKTVVINATNDNNRGSTSPSNTSLNDNNNTSQNTSPISEPIYHADISPTNPAYDSTSYNTPVAYYIGQNQSNNYETSPNSLGYVVEEDGVDGYMNGRNNNMNNNPVQRRGQSRLLIRHFTRAAIFSHPNENTEGEMSPALKRRLRDFRFAQKKRKDKYGEQNPWGIIGLYDHLTGIRTDIEWAEDAAWRRENDEPYLSWQDFEDAKDTGFNKPFFTYFIMIVCTICLIASIGLNGWTVDSITNNPMIGPTAQVLIQMGAKYTPKIVNDNEWFRIFTAMFLHAGIIHFIVNMLALWFIGSAVEQSHGFLAAALLFILPAIGGTLLSALFLPEYISVGASGGIFGLIGACLADVISNWGLLFSKYVNDNNKRQRFRHIKVLIWLVLDIILNIVIGLTPLVDNFTHLGGMLFGFFCGLSTMERLSKAFFGVETNFCSRVQTFLVRFIGIILSVICIIIAFILLASLKNGTNFSCRWCRYFSCVPFPFWETETKWWYCDDCDKSVVKAQLYPDPATLIFTSMDLTCPDNSTIFNVTIDDATSNVQEIKEKLSTYCREECDSIYIN